MNSKIVIGKVFDGISITRFEDRKAVELIYEKLNPKVDTLGNIYIGRVENVVTNINAAFIEIAPKVPCYYSLKDNQNPIFTQKIGKKPICQGEQLLVQVQKEAMKTKVPTVSANLNFTGEYVVLTTGNKTIGVSKKVSNADGKALKELLVRYQSDEYGMIARTNAASAPIEEVERELQLLIQDYKTLVEYAATRTCFSCMKKAIPFYVTYIQSCQKQEITEIVVEDSEIYEEIASYMKAYNPEMYEKITLYQDCNYPLKKLYNLEGIMKEATQKKVWMKSGAYLVIEPTEALTVIDVNTGKCATKKEKQDLFFMINVEAAKECARQMQLRNLSGIIVIDFINLRDKQKMKEVLSIFNQCLKQDKIETKLVGITKLQLVEVTRKKVRKSLKESLVDSYE